MYKLITKGIATNGVVNWSFYKEHNTEFATKNFDIAVEKYRLLMNNYSLNNLKLVDDIDLTVEVAVEPILDTIVPVIGTDIINDGTVFSIKILKDTSDYIWIDYNVNILNDVRTYLESLGLTNIEIVAWHGTITALNPSGEPVIGAYIIPSGLLTAYDNVNKTTNNISGEFEFEIV